MAIAVEIHEGGPPVADDASGEGWEASLFLAWAQIIEGSATCAHCGESATVVIATGADPDYDPMCWEAALRFIESSRDLGSTLFGKRG